jgi:hypothetical protein
MPAPPAGGPPPSRAPGCGPAAGCPSPPASRRIPAPQAAAAAARRPRAARPRPGRPCGPPPKMTPTVVASDAGLSHLMREGSNPQVKQGQRRQPPALAWPAHVAAMSSLATGTPRLAEANTDNSRCSHAARRVFAPNAIRGPSHIPPESGVVLSTHPVDAAGCRSRATLAWPLGVIFASGGGPSGRRFAARASLRQGGACAAKTVMITRCPPFAALPRSWPGSGWHPRRWARSGRSTTGHDRVVGRPAG